MVGFHCIGILLSIVFLPVNVNDRYYRLELTSLTYNFLPFVPRTKSVVNILASDACRANIIRSKEASLGVALLSLRPNIRPVCKALPAELMITLRAYQNYSAIGTLK